MKLKREKIWKKTEMKYISKAKLVDESGSTRETVESNQRLNLTLRLSSRLR